MRSSVPLMRLRHTDEASDLSVTAAVDQVSQQPSDNSTPDISDDDTLPKKFLNRNPRYVYSSVYASQILSSFVWLVMFVDTC